jgi:hypothetical protein
MAYPAQEKPPLDPQLLPPDPEVALVEEPNEATCDIFFWVSWLWQLGQTGLRSASDQRTIFSNTSPQALQRYS